MKKIGSILITSILFIVLFSMTVFGAGTNKGNATAMQTDKAYQSNLSLLETEWYKITPYETQYYRFHILNQSVEARTGIANGYLDDFINFFQGYLTITIRDQYDMTLAEYNIRCGYEGRISLKLQMGQTYYVFIKSTVTGNYRLTATKLADIGADTWSDATSAISNAQIISAIDTTSDSDWFTFNAEPERAYYTFNLENISGTSTMNFVLYQYVAGAGEFPMRKIESMSVGRGSTKSFNLQLEENSKYYYRIYGDGSCTGGYQLDVTMRLDAAGNSMSEAYTVKPNEKYLSSYDGNSDTDYYVFKTSKEESYYHFYFNNLNDGLRRFYVYDTDGNEVLYASSDYYSLDKNTKLKTDSTYYVKFIGSNSNYEFKITQKKDAYPDILEKAKTVSLNKKYTSSYDGTSDIDYVKFKTSSEKAYYHFYLNNLNGGLRRFSVYDTDGNEVLYASSDYYAVDKSIKLETNSTYYVELTGSNSNYEFKISYTVDKDSDEKEKATSIKLNTPKESHLEASSDVDWFKIKLNSSGEYRIRCYSMSSTSVYYDIYNSYDGYISVGYTGTTYLEAGTYYVKITGSTGHYGFILADCGSGHKEKITYDPKSTLKMSGVKKTVCKSCKQVLNTETVPQIKSVKLSKKAYDYNGKVRRPKITVTDTNGTVIKSYSVSWSNKKSTAPGKYTATVTFKGKYSGKKTVTYYIKPTAVKKLSASVKGNTVKLSWSKVKGNVEYEIYRSNGKKWEKVAVTDKTSYTVKGLKSDSKYSFKVRAVVGSYKGTFSPVVTKKTKIATVTLSKLTAGSKQLTATWKTVSGATGYEVAYSTSKKFSKKTTKKVTIKKAKTKKTTIKKLKKGKKYYVKVRAYKTVSGKKMYGAYSSAKSIKVK